MCYQRNALRIRPVNNRLINENRSNKRATAMSIAVIGPFINQTANENQPPEFIIDWK